MAIITIIALVIGCVPCACSPEGKGLELPPLVMREPGHTCQKSQPTPRASGEGQAGTNGCGQRDQGRSWCPAYGRAGSWALALNKSGGHCIMEQGPALGSDGCWSLLERGLCPQCGSSLWGEERRDGAHTGLACGSAVRMGLSTVGCRAGQLPVRLCSLGPPGLLGRGEGPLSCC